MRRKKKSSKLNTKKYLSIAIILVAMVSAFTLSRYESAIAGSVNAKVADFEISILGPGSTAVDLEIELDNTTKLYDDENFDEVVVIRNIKVVNNSEVSVNLKAQIESQMSEGLLWYIADYGGIDFDFATAIQSKLIETGYTSFDEDVSYGDLKNALEYINSETIENLDVNLGMESSNNSQNFIIMIWAEHIDNIDAEAIGELNIIPFKLNIKQIAPI